MFYHSFSLTRLLRSMYRTMVSLPMIPSTGGCTRGLLSVEDRKCVKVLVSPTGRIGYPMTPLLTYMTSSDPVFSMTSKSE